MFPIVDGHFWVVRDGNIIDPHFKEYDLVKKIQGCVGEPIHLPADDLVQKVILKKFTNVCSVQDMGIMFQQVMGKPMPNSCYQNACLEIVKNGGQLVFGSLGWTRRSGGVHYEFGGEGWKVAQFIK